MGINWTVSREDRALIGEIVERAERAFAHLDLDRVETEMDITAVHANGCPLDLAGLLAAERFDFMHDVSGIKRYVDRQTGALTDSFVPRCARREAEAAEAVGRG